MFSYPLIMKALEPHCQQPLEGKKKRASLLVRFFFPPLSCDHPILQILPHTVVCDPGDETAVPAPGGLLSCLFMWPQGDRIEKHTNNDCV